MSPHAQPIPTVMSDSLREKVHVVNWERAGVVYARLAVGSAFLSAVASRFGFWQGTMDLKHFQDFLQYAREVLAFVPKASIPFFAWSATVCEASLGVLLLLGLWLRWVSLASAFVLAIFGISMAISQGLKSPMDYSVYSASSAAVLLALVSFRRHRKETSEGAGS
jgi:putative oxidoreductase